MRKASTLFLAIFILSLTPQKLFAGATEDAHYIAEQTANKRIFQGAITAVGPTLVSAVENDLRKKGITISDVQTFQDLLVAAFLDEFTTNMQIASEKHYLETFSEAELAGIAEFYRSDAGQALIFHTPEMMQFGATKGREIGRIAGMHAGPRIAKQMEEQGIVITTDKSMMQRLIDALK